MPAKPPEPVPAWRGLAWLLLTVLLVAQVWALYLVVPGEGEPFVPHQDKLGHAVLFGAPFALALVLRSRVAALGLIGHALASEVLQHVFTSTRMVDPWDAVANLVGIGLAGLLVGLARRLPDRPAPREPSPVGVSQ